MADLTGQLVGQYTLRERIGKGGMADIYRARQESMDRDVAIKVMASSLVDNEEFLARFEREARVIARLQHPHILPVFDFGRSGEYVYLVMRLVTGGVLSARLQQTTLTLAQADRFLQQIGSALEYAHQRGVIHRDLKPSNVLLDEEDNVYLTDFGIAKMLAGTSGANLTATGRVMGTPAYMAPEQWRSEPVDARTDIYALGVILYEMLVGAQPFQAETPFGMMYKHFDTLPPRPRVVNPELPAGVEAVILRALAKDANARYGSAQQMTAAFHDAVQALPPQVTGTQLPRAEADQLAQATVPGSDASPPSPPPAAALTPPPPAYPAQPPMLPGARPAPGRSALFWGIVGLGMIALVVVIAALAVLLLSRDANSGSDNGAGSGALPTRAQVAGDEHTATDDDGALPGQDRTATPSPTERVTPLPLTAAASRPPAHTATPYTPRPTATSKAIAELTRQAAGAMSTPLPPTIQPTLAPSPTFTPSGACGTLPARMTVGQGGRTTLYPDALTRVRNAPGFAAPTERRIPPGQMLMVIGGPQCADDVVWWQIKGVERDGLWQGWIGEGRDGTYWIEPFDTGPIDCPPAPPPRLTPGERGRVTLFPDLPSRVRSAPRADTLANVIDRLQPGDTFDVISGPVCASDYRWWEIEAGGVRGWIAEGVPGEYWIEPLP